MHHKKIIGFTLAELIVVTALIGFIVSIALYNYSRIIQESRKSACISNLKEIQGAIERWALENSVPDGTIPDEQGVYSYLKGGRPVCPSGGTYVLEAVGTNPGVSCTLADRGHKLE